MKEGRQGKKGYILNDSNYKTVENTNRFIMTKRRSVVFWDKIARNRREGLKWV